MVWIIFHLLTKSSKDLLSQDSIHPMQEEVAKEMIKKISKSQADTFQKTFKYFDVFTIVPFFKSLGRTPSFHLLSFLIHFYFFSGKQTVNRWRSFIESKENFLNDIQRDTASSQVQCSWSRSFLAPQGL